jgi:hypothetical protein
MNIPPKLGTVAPMKGWRPLLAICGVWFALGAAVTLYYFLPANIFGSQWSFPLSPARLGVFDRIAFATATPLAILVIFDQARRPSWLAPRGRYVEGRKYSLFTPRRFIEIAFLAALLLAFNNITLPFPGVSLVVIGLLFGAAYFGPITVYTANWIANILGGVLGMPFALGLGGVIGMVGRSLFDGAIFAFAAWFFFMYIIPPGKAVPPARRIAMYLAWFAAWNAIHLVYWTAISIPVLVGSPGWYGYMIVYLSTNYPTNILSGIVGVAAAEAGIRATRGRTPRPAMTGSSASVPSPPATGGKPSTT